MMQTPFVNQGKSVLMLVIIIAMNFIILYSFIFLHGGTVNDAVKSSSNSSSCDSATLILQLNATRHELHVKESLIDNLKKELESAQSQNAELRSRHMNANSEAKYRDLVAGFSGETKIIVDSHKLFFGNTPRIGTKLPFSYGARCLNQKRELMKYMSYQVGGECPIDDDLAQTLMLKGCEPLPRRRCYTKTPPNYVEPTPLPESLWSTPSDKSIIWDPYPCKNYTCLAQRWRLPGSERYDCKDCFDLENEASRWTHKDDLYYALDEVLALKPGRTIRIGLDIGGGSGTFAARMMERNVTIISTSMNFDAPFNSFIASRGLLALHITISHRLPFFDNTLDIVHSMHVLSHWIPDIMLEFILYDIHRVLRPGGLFWLDHFFCYGSQMNQTYVPMFKSLSFKIRRWSIGKKLDRRIQDEVYISAIFEKPLG